MAKSRKTPHWARRYGENPDQGEGAGKGGKGEPQVASAAGHRERYDLEGRKKSIGSPRTEGPGIG